jgi:hypothetical protein
LAPDVEEEEEPLVQMIEPAFQYLFGFYKVMVELKVLIVVEEEFGFEITMKVVAVVVMEAVEAFVVFALTKKMEPIVVEHDDAVDAVQKQAEVVNELVEEPNC